MLHLCGILTNIIDLYFLPNQLIDKYWQMAGGSYTGVTNHKKCWLELKMCLSFNLYVYPKDNTLYQVYEILYVLFLWSFKFMKFYVWYFLFLLIPWVKNVTKWMCRTFEHLDFYIETMQAFCDSYFPFFFFFSFVDIIIHLINQIFYYYL